MDTEDAKIKNCKFCDCLTYDCDVCGFCAGFKARLERIQMMKSHGEKPDLNA